MFLGFLNITVAFAGAMAMNYLLCRYPWLLGRKEGDALQWKKKYDDLNSRFTRSCSAIQELNSRQIEYWKEQCRQIKQRMMTDVDPCEKCLDKLSKISEKYRVIDGNDDVQRSY